MGMVTVGPLALPNAAFAAVLALIVFSLLTYFATRADPRFDRWSTAVLLLGFLVARLVYVAKHWPAFMADPWRIVMIWQGGFQWVAGVLVAIGLTFWLLKTRSSRRAGTGIIVVSIGLWLGVMALLQDTRYDRQLPAEMQLVNLEGEPFSLQDYQQGPVVVNLWATWCPPCRRELPAMAQQARQLPQLPFLFINQTEDAVLVQSYLSSQGLQLDHVVLDPGSRSAQVFETVGLPMTLFFYDGRLKQVHAGEITAEVLEAEVRALLAHGK